MKPPTHSSHRTRPSTTAEILWATLTVVAVSCACLPLARSSTLNVTVFTDSSLYDTSDNIYVYGSVLLDGVPVLNTNVALEIHDPTAGPVIARSVQTNSSGMYSVTFKLSSDAITGTYTAYVNCAYGADTASANTSFQFVQISMLEITIVCDKAQYRVGESISLGGNVTLNGAKLSQALVAVEVLNPNLEPVIVRVVQTNDQGVYALAFQSSQDSPLGTYAAYASVNYEDTNATAETSFQLAYTQVSADINGDGKVNIVDLTLVAKAYGSYPGHPRWDPMCNMNGDDIINIIDLTFVASKYRPS